MNESQINLDLYHKMREEQDEYRHWLLAQTPKEILNHASEYSVREDILATMCEGHLPPMLAKALMNTEHPLACVYAELQNSDYRDRSYEDLIDVIQSCAKKELRQSPKFMEICIYQIDPDKDQHRIAFCSLEELMKFQGSDRVESGIYNRVFQGIVDCSTLDGVYYKFNSDPPEGYTGSPLTISDVVHVIHSQPVEPGFYFCEKFGYKRIDFEPEKTQDMTHAISVLLLEPGKVAKPTLVNNTLKDMQQLVGGHIEVLSLPGGCQLVCNEDGKFLTLPQNRALKDKAGKVVDVLVGTCFICGAKGDEFISLTPDQMKQFKKEFQYPQKLVRRNNEIVAKDIKPHEMER